MFFGARLCYIDLESSTTTLVLATSGPVVNYGSIMVAEIFFVRISSMLLEDVPASSVALRVELLDSKRQYQQLPHYYQQMSRCPWSYCEKILSTKDECGHHPDHFYSLLLL